MLSYKFDAKKLPLALEMCVCRESLTISASVQQQMPEKEQEGQVKHFTRLCSVGS